MNGVRLPRVWATTFRILLSAGTFQVLSRLRGRAWAEEALPRWVRCNARRARLTVTRVGGLFVKVGQMVSMLAGALPADAREELAGLQDRIPPRPWDEIADRIEGELGSRPETLFASIDRAPIAAASLAQVHSAVLVDGRRVAVKVQHRDIEQLAAKDLGTVRQILGIVGLVTRARGLPDLFDEVRTMIEDELDFSKEAEHARVIADQFADDPSIAVPEVVAELSTPRVLVTTLFDGVKITDRDAVAALGVDIASLAPRVLEAYCRMIFEAGTYHADPHPGNLLVDREGRIAFVDFGAVGRITDTMRAGIPELVESVVRRDRATTLAALGRLGFVPRSGVAAGGDVAERLIDYVYGRFLDQIDWQAFDLGDVRFDASLKVELMADMRHRDLALHDITAAVQVPREWVLLLRTLMLLLGLSTELDPTLRPVRVLRPHLEPLLLGEGRDWLGLLGVAVKDLGLAAFTLPSDLRRLVSRAESGHLGIEVGGLREGALVLHGLGRQALFVLVALASAGLAYAAHGNGDVTVMRIALGVATASTVGLVVSWWRARRWVRQLRRAIDHR